MGVEGGIKTKTTKAKNQVTRRDVTYKMRNNHRRHNIKKQIVKFVS